MLCRKPYMVDGVFPAGCMKCLPCRINRRREWSHRILLESFKHGDSCFVTLTYDDDHCPGSLQKSHYQTWLKRLRKVLAPQKIRYFIAGEYGEESGRPHFHAAVFGLSALVAGGVDGREGVVKQCWPFGYTFVGTLTWESAQYIAGYLTKKAVDDEQSVRAFSRMSLRPGIGRPAVEDIAKSLSSVSGSAFIRDNGDVPSALRHARRMLPLGRYLRRELRGELGLSKDTPEVFKALQALRQADQAREERSALYKEGFKGWQVSQITFDRHRQKINNMESRFKVRDSQRKLK